LQRLHPEQLLHPLHFIHFEQFEQAQHVLQPEQLQPTKFSTISVLEPLSEHCNSLHILLSCLFDNVFKIFDNSFSIIYII
jgi:hypothetical protein